MGQNYFKDRSADTPVRIRASREKSLSYRMMLFYRCRDRGTRVSALHTIFNFILSGYLTINF